jgi:hypothetical protein
MLKAILGPALAARLLLLCGLSMMLGLLLAPGAFAAEGIPSPDDELILSSDQFYAVLIGAIVPIGTYVLNNRVLGILSEPVKGAIMAGVAALAGVLYQLLETGGLSLDTETLQMVFFAVVGAVMAHTQFYIRAGWNTKLGAGSPRAKKK